MGYQPTFTVTFEVVVPTQEFGFDDNTSERDLILFAVNNALDWINSDETAHVTWIDEQENEHSIFVDVKHGYPMPSWRNEYWEEDEHVD